MDTNARAAGGRLGFPTGPGQPRGWTNALEGQMQQAGVSATEQQLVQAERALQRSMLSPAQQRQMRALENGLETVRRDTDNGTLPRTVGEQSQEMLQIALNRFRHGTVDTPTLQRHVAFLTGMLHAENAAIQLGAAELHHARIANGTLPTGTFINPLDGQRDFWVETAPGHREIQRRPPPQRPAVTPHQLAEHEHTVRMGIHRELAHDVRESAKTLDDEGNPNQPAWVANAVVTNPQRTAAGLPDLPRTLEEATRQEEERLVGEAMARYRALHGETGGGAQGATAGTGGAAAGPSAAAPTTAAPAQTIRQQVVAKHGDEQMLFVVTNLESLIRRYPRGPQTMPIDERAYYRRMRERVETFLSQGSPQQRPAAGPGPALGMGMGLMGN